MGFFGGCFALRFCVWLDNLILSGRFQVVGNRLIFIESDMTGVGAHKAFVENTARQLVEVFFFEGLQHPHSDFCG